MAEINEFSYSYKRPSPIRWEAWETSCPNGHRLILKVRRSRIVRPPKHLSYQARCTCKKWASETWHRSHLDARKDFLIDHCAVMAKAEIAQGKLL